LSLKKTLAYIRRYKNFLITSHTNLEGDALGSELAFYFLLKKMGKGANIVNEDSAPLSYDFLPGINKINKFTRKLAGVKFDCFAILDCSSPQRCGRVWQINTNNKPTLNIDHHISNKKFAAVNWVETNVSSCSEMIYRLYKELGIRFDKTTATLLYVGILTDTGSFRYSNTTTQTHKIAAELLKYDLDTAKIYNQAYGNMPFEDAKLFIKIASKMKLAYSGKLAWFEIERDTLKNKSIRIDLSEYLMNFARAIKGVEVAVLLRENLGSDEVKINFRSQSKVDVNKIASFFGGGGHKTASGATITGNISKARRKVLAKIKESFI